MKKTISLLINITIILSLFSSIIPAQKAEARGENVPSQKYQYSFDVTAKDYQSLVLKSAIPFTGISSKWNSGLENVDIYLRSGKQENTLGDWALVSGDGRQNDSAGDFIFGDIFNSDKDDYFQYKATFNEGDIGKKLNLKLGVFDTSGQTAPSLMRASSDSSGLGPRIISRTEWGANNNYMTWKPEYDEVKAIVIHHTAGEEGAKVSDQMSVVRNLYYGHAVSYGWGDVGYNYIIDANGAIYEGRAGGGGVVAGHTLGYNNGTIGIVLIGDYNVRTPSPEQYEALTNFIAYKSFQYGIDPNGTVYLKNKTIPTVVGHRDLNATLCPGVSVYERIVGLRLSASDKLKTYPQKTVGSQFISSDSNAQLYGGDVTKVKVSLKNTGNTPWYKGSKNGFDITAKVASKVSIVLENFGRSVEPGETGNFILAITAPTTNEAFNQVFEPRVGGNAISSSSEFNINLNIVTPEYRGKVMAKNADQGIIAGKQATLWVDVKNTGTKSWGTGDGIKIFTKSGGDSKFYTEGDWESKKSAAGLDNSNISSGSTGRISFLVTAPSTAGQYTETFIIRSDSKNITGGADLEVSWNISVTASGGSLTNTTFEQKTYSTLIGDYGFTIVNQSSALTLNPAGKGNAWIELKNTGKSNWYKDIVHLGVINDKDSVFADSSWLSKNRLKMNQDKVAPGETARFDFTVTAPAISGTTRENFGLVVEQIDWLKTPAIYWDFTVTAPVYSGQVLEKNVPAYVNRGTSASINIKVKNTGNTAWSKDIVHLGTANPQDRSSQMADITWLAPNRIALTENIVAPGAIGNFSFTINSSKITSDKTSGYYSEAFRPVAEGITWFGEVPLIEFYIKDLESALLADDFTYIGQSPYPTVVAGQTTQLWIDLKNTGQSTWGMGGVDPVRLGTSNPRDRKSDFLPTNRVTMDNGPVAPGQTARFTFTITAPTTVKTYREYFALVHDGVAWMKDIGIYWDINVVSAKDTNATPTANTNTGILTGIPTGVQTVVVSSSGPFIVVNSAVEKIATGGSGDKIETFYKDGKNYFRINNGAIQEASGFVRIVPWAAQTILTVDSYTDKPSWNPSINDNKFKGVVEVRYSTKNKKLWVINELNIEDYLRGVSEPLEAGPYEYIKAAVIAERSYIYYHLSRGGRWPDDFITLKNSRNGNGDDQIYQGYGFTSRATNIPKAVGDTEGQVVTYNGKPVLTPYYTQSDGKTRDISKVWGSNQNDYPWLVAVDDPWCAGLQTLGHGVGMSGRGARGMASDGKNYKQILNYFYTGTDVGKIDTNLNVRIGIYAIGI